MNYKQPQAKPMDPFVREVVSNYLAVAFEDAAEAVKATRGYSRMHPDLVQEVIRQDAYQRLGDIATVYENESQHVRAEEIVNALRSFETRSLPDLTNEDDIRLCQKAYRDMKKMLVNLQKSPAASLSPD